MAEKYVIATAKSATELDEAYTKAKSLSKGYGFTSVAALKEEVVSKAMTDAKKPADFVVEVDVGKTLMVQMVCDVKGKLRSVIGRVEIKDVNAFINAKMLAKQQALQKVAAANGWKL